MRNEFHGWCKSHRRLNNKVDFEKKNRSARQQKKGPWDESVNESGEHQLAWEILGTSLSIVFSESLWHTTNEGPQYWLVAIYIYTSLSS